MSCFAAQGFLLCSASCALQHQRPCFAARGCALQRQERTKERSVLWGTRLCFVAPGGMGGTGGLCSAAPGERGLCFGAPGSALQHQWGWGGTGWLCFAAPGEGRGEGFVLWSTRLSFAAPEKMGGKKGGEERGLCFAAPEGMDGNKGVVLCSARGGERTGACAFGIQGALQHEGGWGGTGGLCFPGEGRGEGLVLLSTRLCFAAPGKMGGNRGVVLCSARGGERRKVRALEHQIVLCSTRADGGEEGGCALQRHMHGSILASRPGKKTQSAPESTMGKLKVHEGALWENTERTQTKLTSPLSP